MRTQPFKIFLLIGFMLVINAGQTASAQSRKADVQTQPDSLSVPDQHLKDESQAIEGMKFLMRDEPAKALPIFEKLIEKTPGKPASHYMLARTLVKLDRTDDAIVAARKAYELEKNNIYYTQQLGELLAKKRKYAEAAQIYQALVAKNPDNIQYGIELAAIYVFNDQYDKAITTYDNLERSIGVTEEITHQKQQLYLRQNKLEKALAEAKKLITAEPAEVGYRIELAEMLIANDRVTEAILPLEDALKINPDEAQAHVLLADIYRRNGDIEKCNRELKLVFANPNLEAEPKIRVLSGYVKMLNDSKANIVYADQLIRTGKKAEARDIYAKAARLDGSTFEVWGALLQLDGELNQVDSMLVHSELALEVFPNQGLLWYSNGTAHLMKKDFNRAISSLEESMKLITDKPDMIPYIHAQLGDAYNGLGNHEKSDAAYDLALKENPDNDHVLNNYSYFLSLRKVKLDQALKMSQKLVQMHADNPTYLDTHAWVLYILKDYQKAKTYLEKAISIESALVSGTIVEHYGDVLFRLGERENAVTQWKKAKKMGETTELLDKKIATGALHEQ
jgi:tetratricopeptide (TPR) repeat protein